MTSLKLLAAGAALAVLAGAAGAQAQDFRPKTAGTFVIDARVSDVAPQTSDAITTVAGADTGLTVHASDSVMPTLGFSYFFTDHIAVEAILGTTHHNIYAEGAGDRTKVYDTWVLPPVVTLQYHPMPAARVSPYVGAGVNAMLFYGDGDHNGFKVHVKNGVGWALQGGVDVAISGPWSVNADVKKVFFNTDASINNGALRSDVSLDPWVVSVGLARKF